MPMDPIEFSGLMGPPLFYNPPSLADEVVAVVRLTAEAGIAFPKDAEQSFA
jgi:hypothetical protein